MKLYHYTSREHLKKILEDGYIKTTSSNLLEPKAPCLTFRDDGTAVFADPATDNYKPVVWLTDLLDFETATKHGLSEAKTEAAIELEITCLTPVEKWTSWAERNGIDKAWYAALKKAAPLWRTFYVCEQAIPIDANTMIAFRPDIYDEFSAR